MFTARYELVFKQSSLRFVFKLLIFDTSYGLYDCRTLSKQGHSYVGYTYVERSLTATLTILIDSKLIQQYLLVHCCSAPCRQSENFRLEPCINMNERLYQTVRVSCFFGILPHISVHRCLLLLMVRCCVIKYYFSKCNYIYYR